MNCHNSSSIRNFPLHLVKLTNRQRQLPYWWIVNIYDRKLTKIHADSFVSNLCLISISRERIDQSGEEPHVQVHINWEHEREVLRPSNSNTLNPWNGRVVRFDGQRRRRTHFISKAILENRITNTSYLYSIQYIHIFNLSSYIVRGKIHSRTRTLKPCTYHLIEKLEFFSDLSFNSGDGWRSRNHVTFISNCRQRGRPWIKPFAAVPNCRFVNELFTAANTQASTHNHAQI